MQQYLVIIEDDEHAYTLYTVQANYAIEAKDYARDNYRSVESTTIINTYAYPVLKGEKITRHTSIQA